MEHSSVINFSGSKMDTTEEEEEVVSTGAMSIDLDVAFNMQMQEAINASLALHSPPEPTLNHFEDSIADNYLAFLIAEDIARFEQEKMDQRLAEVEMLRVKEEFGRLVHDRRFAHELDQMSNQTGGSAIERPYGDGASSSHSTVTNNNELFNLYTKGILWQGAEIKGHHHHKILGGIGIALCDLGNNVVFRMAKPEEVAVEMVEEALELKALAEGLNIALQFGINRVSLFTDDVHLHGYVRGTLEPKHENLEFLLDQLSFTFRKFDHWTLSLIEKKNVNIAGKLARHAIVSQITKDEDENNNIGKNLVNCSICYEDKDNFHMHYLDDCLHSYCPSCMEHVEAKLLNGVLPKCPHEGCKSSLTPDSCREFLPTRLYDLFMQRVNEASIPAARRIYCPNPRCSVLMPSTVVLPSVNANLAIECTKCFMLFCGHCKVPWHSNMTCVAYGKLYPYPNEGDAKLKFVAAKNKWRQCVKCKNMVELGEGCYHIYCRCGHEFCYTCGADWRNRGQTCKCPVWDAQNHR